MADPNAPAIRVAQLRLPKLKPLDLVVERGSVHRLTGPPGSGKSRMLLMLAGLERCPRKGCVEVFGQNPSAIPSGDRLYLGPRAPMLKGSLRRTLTLGTGRKPSDDEIVATIDRCGLTGLVERIGGLDGKVSEGSLNLTSSERAGLFLIRGLIARPSLALVDAEELGFDAQTTTLLLQHFAEIECAALVVTGVDYSGPEPTIALVPELPTDEMAPNTSFAA